MLCCVYPDFSLRIRDTRCNQNLSRVDPDAASLRRRFPFSRSRFSFGFLRTRDIEGFRAGCRARSKWSVFRAGEHSKIHALAWDYGVLHSAPATEKFYAMLEICILRNTQERGKRAECTCSLRLFPCAT